MVFSSFLFHFYLFINQVVALVSSMKKRMNKSLRSSHSRKRNQGKETYVHATKCVLPSSFLQADKSCEDEKRYIRFRANALSPFG